MTRTDTTPQSEAAEVRTVAELLDRGLVAGQYPRNFHAADVYAFAATVNRVIRIQVKYRHGSDASYVTLSTLEGFEFLVVFRANRTRPVAGRSAMQCWVIPASALNGDRIQLAQLPDAYLNAWHLIEAAANG